MRVRVGLAGIECAPSASTMKRPSPGPFSDRHAERVEQREVVLRGRGRSS